MMLKGKKDCDPAVRVQVTAAHVKLCRLRCRSANVESKQRANVARTLLQHMDSDGDDIDMKTLEVCPSSPNLVLRVLLLLRCCLVWVLCVSDTWPPLQEQCLNVLWAGELACTFLQLDSCL